MVGFVLGELCCTFEDQPLSFQSLVEMGWRVSHGNLKLYPVVEVSIAPSRVFVRSVSVRVDSGDEEAGWCCWYWYWYCWCWCGGTDGGGSCIRSRGGVGDTWLSLLLTIYGAG